MIGNGECVIVEGGTEMDENIDEETQFLDSFEDTESVQLTAMNKR